MVVFTGSQADVAASIAFAAQRRLPLCARAGGHDFISASICDGGIVVDVSKLKEVSPGLAALESSSCVTFSMACCKGCWGPLFLTEHQPMGTLACHLITWT
jgi:hypothetical protein